MYAPAIFIALGCTLLFWRHIDPSARGVIVFALGCMILFIAISAISARRTRRLLEQRERAIEAIRRGEDVSHMFQSKDRPARRANRADRADHHDAA